MPTAPGRGTMSPIGKTVSQRTLFTCVRWTKRAPTDTLLPGPEKLLAADRMVPVVIFLHGQAPRRELVLGGANMQPAR